ncbi:MAG: PASTA domain-containing protein [Clostridia bacterium]|nr:PASTA domain-containing protein [Clostridia bacterium]
MYSGRVEGVPDVVGLPCGEAMDILRQAGIAVTRVEITYPPREKSESFDDSYRVIRIKNNAGKSVELLVCKPL